MLQRPQLFIFTTAFHPHVGGAEMAVQELLPALSERFHCVVITARMRGDIPKRDEYNGVEVIRVGIGSPMLDKVMFMVCGWWHVLRNKTSNRVGVWAVMASYGGVAAVITQVLLGIPYALTLQEGDDLRLINERVAPIRVLFAQIFRRAHGIQAIATFLTRWAAEFGPLKCTPVVVPNGVPVNVFLITSQDRATWRTQVRLELGIPDDAFVIFTVSRLVPKNGISDLIAAAKLMQNTYLIIAGDGALRHELEALSNAQIYFVGTMDRAGILRHAAASDVFCRPALSEGQGIVFLEAMAMELPVVATDVGGIPETVTPGTGVLVVPHDPQALAKVLQTLQSDADARVALVREASAHVKQFEWSLLAPRIVSWISESLFRA